MSAACIKSYDKAENGTLSPLECLSFVNTIQADLPTCGSCILEGESNCIFFWKVHLDAKLKQVFCRAGRYLIEHFFIFILGNHVLL